MNSYGNLFYMIYNAFSLTALYSYFPYRKKQVYKELKRTLALSYASLHRRQQTKRRVIPTKEETPPWHAKEGVSLIYIQLKQFIYIPASS